MATKDITVPGLDPRFSPLGLFHREQSRAALQSGKGNTLRLALERESGHVSVFETAIGDAGEAATLLHAERLAKFLLCINLSTLSL